MAPSKVRSSCFMHSVQVVVHGFNCRSSVSPLLSHVVFLYRNPRRS